MTLPQDELREQMKMVGKVLRPLGFRGSVNYWRCVTDHGLAAIRRYSDRDRDGLAFRFVVEGTPRIWWEFGNWQAEREGREALPLDDKNVAGLQLREDPAPDGEQPRASVFHIATHAALEGEQAAPPLLWKIRQQDGVLLDSDVNHVREKLPAAVEWMGRRAQRLANPGEYLRDLLALPDKDNGAREIIAVLLAEYGPSQALDEAVDQMKAAFTARGAHDYAESIIEFVYSRG